MTEHMSAAAFRAEQSKPQKRRQKYNAKRVLLDGICFDSKAESKYYAELKVRERAGEVTDIELQRRFDLMVNGGLAAVFVADFVYFDRVMCRRRVVDVKGAPVTREFRIKQKLMKSIFGIEVEVVRMK